MEEHMMVHELLEQALREKKISIARIAELTDIPERYVTLLITGERQGLPPAPYVRGYLIKIATALGLDGQAMWQLYRKQQELKTSGERDTLPTNRFAFRRMSKRSIWIVVVAAIAVLAGGWWLHTVMGSGHIDISNPAENNVVVHEAFIDVRGTVQAGDRLTINNEDVPVDRSGYFEKRLSLEPGVNTVEFKAKRLLGKEQTVVRQVIYQQ